MYDLPAREKLRKQQAEINLLSSVRPQVRLTNGLCFDVADVPVARHTFMRVSVEGLESWVR